MFTAIKKLLSGKSSYANKIPMIETCPDCGVQSGEWHDFLCTKESCPFCGGQLLTCDCANDILNLSDDEQRVVDEFVDDSIPPLSDIMQRWRDALAAKGRVPFTAFADDPIRAAYRGDIAVMQRFFDAGFDPNAGNEVGYTTLMGAARGEKVDMIRFLLARGARVALADKRGYTALHWAVAQPVNDSSGQATCVLALIEAGADPNARNQEDITPLMNAAWFGCHDAVQMLLQRGANSLLRDSKGKSARDFAAQRGHKDVEKLFVSHG